MISPLQKVPTDISTSPAAPRHIGQLLPQVLARYGIVVTQAELAALCPSIRRTSAAPMERDRTLSRRWKLPAQQMRSKPSKAAVLRRHKMVQLPLFPSIDYQARSSLAVR